MPWLPLAILLIAILTIAALALILFPPGEAREEVADDDITHDANEEMTEEDVAGDVVAEATEDDLSPPSVDGDRHPQADTRLRGEDEESHSESGASIAPAPPPGRNLQS